MDIESVLIAACIMDMQHGHPAWTCSMEMQIGNAAWTCSMSMQMDKQHTASVRNTYMQQKNTGCKCK
jgi:hypothetical protein